MMGEPILVSPIPAYAHLNRFDDAKCVFHSIEGDLFGHPALALAKEEMRETFIKYDLQLIFEVLFVPGVAQ